MNIRRYFDLSQPATLSDPKPAKQSAVAAAPAPASAHPLPLGWQIVTYVVLVLAIMASRYLDLVRAGTASSFHLDLPYLIFLVIVALLVFPVVYDKACFNRDKPVLLQIGFIFSAGMGWEKIVSTSVGK